MDYVLISTFGTWGFVRSDIISDMSGWCCDCFIVSQYCFAFLISKERDIKLLSDVPLENNPLKNELGMYNFDWFTVVKELDSSFIFDRSFQNPQ